MPDGMVDREKPGTEEEREIYDMRIATVGLVKRGVNQEEFFLVKSADADEWDEAKVPVEEGPAGSGFKLSDLLGMVKRAVAEAVAPQAPDTGGEQEEVAKMSEKVAPKTEEVEEQGAEPVEARQEEPTVEVEKADTVAQRLPAEMQIRMEELMKESVELKERLEKAEQIAQAERDLRERREWLEKAQAVAAGPAKPEELAEKLHTLAKSDGEAAEWFLKQFEATGQMLKDAGAWAEVGTSQEPEVLTMLEKVDKGVAEGKSVQEVIATLSADEQRAYLRESRKRAREV